MSFMRKGGIVVLSTVLQASVLLSACSWGAKEEGMNKEAVVDAGPKKAFSKLDPPVTITVARSVNSDVKFKQGEDIEHNVHTEWMKNELGIVMKHSLLTAKDEDLLTKLKLALAGSEKLPDIITLPNTNAGLFLLNDLISAGKVQPIDAAIQAYVPDEVKEKYKKYNDAFYAGRRDGETYALPLYTGGMGSTVMWLRTDWLKKLNLEVPKSIDELEKVLQAFTNEDPDGNGKKDTFGLAIGLRDGISGGTAAGDALAGAFTDFIPGSWHEENGGLVYSSTHSSVKPVIQKLRDWMSNGYINPEAGILAGNDALDPFLKEKAGVVFGAFSLGTATLGNLLKVNPKAEFAAFRIPAGSNGEKGRMAQSLSSGYVVFNKDFKHMDAYFEYYNQMMKGRVLGTHPVFKYGFAEGYDYVMQDGKPVYYDFEKSGVPKDKWPQANGLQINVEGYFSFMKGNILMPDAFEKPAKKFYDNPEAEPQNAMEVVVKGWNKSVLHAAIARMADIDSEIKEKYLGPPTLTQQSKGELLKKLEVEAINNIVYSKEPMDYFDKFVANWKSNGGDKITSEVNDWYKKSK